ncbi:MAG: slipin family protein [Pseudomonadota bacterium]
MWPFTQHILIDTTQRGVLLRDGKVTKVLSPGRHAIPVLGKRNQLLRLDVANPLDKSEWVRAFETAKPDLCETHLEIVRPGKGEVALVSLDNKLKYIIEPGGDVAFWKGLRNIRVEILDVSDAPKISREDITRVGATGSRHITLSDIEAGHAGLLFVDGELREQLKPGLHAWWSAVRKVVVKVVDTRRQTTEVTAQEILTKDRVSVRVTLTAFWQITDVVKAGEAKDLNEQIYRHIQFAIRDAVANRTLDELLDARGDLDTELTKSVQAMGAFAFLGVEIDSVGLKDVILPGDMREILNRVVEAEKQAEANVIRRREETAATRSLLNTARLMENNPLLLRMKELETLEKLTEKVGRIDVSTGSRANGLDGLITDLVKLSPPKADDE